MGVLDDIKSRRQQLFGQAVQNVQQAQAPSSPTPHAQVNGQTINQQQIQDAVTGYLQGVQQRRAAKQQQTMAANRHQYSADPMNNLFAPGNTQAVQPQQQPQQSSGTVNQAGAAGIGTSPTKEYAYNGGIVGQPQVADMNDLLTYLERDSKQKLDEATETPEEKAAREKREKNQRLLATIGDGLGAFHEAYSHMMGTKPMTSGSLTAAQEARVKALGLERDKKYSDALSNYVKVLEQQRKGEYYNSIAETRRKQQESLDRDREEKRKETARLNNAKIELFKARQGKLIDESAYNIAYTNAINSGLPESQAIEQGLAASKASLDELARQQRAESDAKVAAGQAQARQRDAAANASNARAEKTRAGGSSGGTTTKTTYDKNGNVKSTVVTTKSNGNSGSSRSSSKGSSGNKNKKRKSRTQA